MGKFQSLASEYFLAWRVCVSDRERRFQSLMNRYRARDRVVPQYAWPTFTKVLLA